MINKNKGITLLALIITIIVMMILAGVSMSMIFGEEGVVTRGRNAAMQTEKKSIHENVLGLITYFEEGIKDLDTTYENIDKHYGTDLIDATRGKTSLTVKIKGKHGEYEYQIDGRSTLNNGDAYAILVDDGSGNSTYTMYFIKNEEKLEVTKTYYYDEELNEIIEDTKENNKISKAKKVEKLYAGIENGRKWADYNANQQKSIVHEIVHNVTAAIFKDYIAIKNLGNWFEEFEKCRTIDLEKLDTSNVTNMFGMFSNCTNLTSIDLSQFNTSKVTNMDRMFLNCKKLTSIKFGENWDTSNVENMNYMFSNCTNLTSIDLSKFSTSKVTNMVAMFSWCGKLTNINFGKNWDTSNVENMNSMFSDCTNLTSIDLSQFNTSKVVDMNAMFGWCGKLTNIEFGENWDTSNVTDMGYMFSDCKNLTSIDLSQFNTSNVTYMFWMFSNCTNLISIDLSQFNTIMINDMSNMFSGCENLTNIILGEDWNTSNVTNMNRMFWGCKKLSLDCSEWNVDNVSKNEYFSHNTLDIKEPNWKT